jgi:hypothetical protein
MNAATFTLCTPSQCRAGSDSLHCRRRVSAQASDFEEYVLELQSSIKSEAERLEADGGVAAVTFKDDR